MAVLPPDPVFAFKGDMGHIHSLCFPKTNYEQTTQIIAATENGFVYLWDLESNRLQHKQNMGTSIQAVHSINNDIITQEKSGLVTRWVIDESTYESDATYNCGGGFCKSILVDDYIILPQESKVDVVDLKTMELKKRLEPDEGKYGNVMSVETIKVGENEYLLAGYETGDVILWDFNSGKKCSHVKLKEHITSLTFDSATLRGVSGNATNILEVFSIDKEELSIKLKGEITITNEGTNVVKLRPSDRKILISGGWDGRIRIFSWKTLRALVVLNEHKGAVTDVQFSPHPVKYWESNIFAASGSDGKISLWNIYN